MFRRRGRCSENNILSVLKYVVLGREAVNYRGENAVLFGDERYPFQVKQTQSISQSSRSAGDSATSPRRFVLSTVFFARFECRRIKFHIIRRKLAGFAPLPRPFGTRIYRSINLTFNFPR